MLRAYLDESGIHGNSPVCLVAGFVSGEESCAKLSWRWQGLLADYHLKQFHTYEYVNRKDVFKPASRIIEPAERGWRLISGIPKREIPKPPKKVWDDATRRQFEIDAIAIINDTLTWPDPVLIVGAAVNTKDFRALSVDERRWLTGGYMTSARKWRRQGAPSKPYFLAFQQAVMDAVKFTQDIDTARRHLGTGRAVNFVFDRQQEYETSARTLYGAMKGAKLSIESRMGSVAFRSKETDIPLQVADFIAYESYSYLFNRIVYGKDALRGEVSARLFSRGLRTVYIDSATLARLLRASPLKPNAIFKLPDPIDSRKQEGLRGR